MIKLTVSISLLLIPSLISADGETVVKNLVWGTITVQDKGTIVKYKDCKLFPKGSTTWDWKKTGTEHRPGIQIADLKDSIDQVDIMILSKGMHGVLETAPETLTCLEEKGKKVDQLLSPEAVKLYNDLYLKGKKLELLFIQPVNRRSNKSNTALRFFSGRYIFEHFFKFPV